MYIDKEGRYMPEIMFRYRELIYRPDFYDFDKGDCTEWMPNGIYNYNVSSMIRDLAWHEENADDGKNHMNKVVKTLVSVEAAISACYGVDGLKQEHIAQADLSRPLIYVELAPDCYNLMDGHHRLAKAKQQGLKELQAYFLPSDVGIHYLCSEEEYCDYVKYWNGKVEDVHDSEMYRGLYTPTPAPLVERDLDADHIWNHLTACLNECRRVELYSEGSWFTLFRLNGKVFCGEAEAHEPTIKIASPFAVTKQMMEALLPEFCEWQRREINSAEKKEIRRTLRKMNRHADVVMACIRIFSEC